MAVTDSSVLAPRADGVLLVVKPGVTKLAEAAQAVEQLFRVNANILGVVLNEVDLSKSRYGYYQYKGYYHSYSAYYGTGKKKKRGKSNHRSKNKERSIEQEPESISPSAVDSE